MANERVLIVENDHLAPSSLGNKLKASFSIDIVSASDLVVGVQKLGQMKFEYAILKCDQALIKKFNLLNKMEQIAKEFRPKQIIIFGVIGPEIKKIKSKIIRFVEASAQEEKLITVIERLTNLSRRKSIDVSMINPFIYASLEVMETFCLVKAQKESVFLRDSTRISIGDISAKLTMVGSNFSGSFAIVFPKALFLTMINRMLGESHREISEEIKDAAAEICNQIYGQAKKRLYECGVHLNMAIPTVRIDRDHQVGHDVEGSCIAVEFSSEEGNFSIEAVVGQ